MRHMQFALIEGQPMLCSEGDSVLLGVRGDCAGLLRSTVSSAETHPHQLGSLNLTTIALMAAVFYAGRCSIVTCHDDATVTRDYYPDL